MKKIFNKFTKYLLLAVMIFSELTTPVKVFAAEEEAAGPKKGDVGINEVVSDDGQVNVASGSLTNQGDIQVTKTVRKSENEDGKFIVEFEVKGKDVTTTVSTHKPIYAVVVFDKSGSMRRNECIFWFFGCREVKFSSAVDGAKTFANSLLRNFSNANLALIEFSTDVNVVRGFQNANFDNASFGSPYGGTNLTGALNEAKTLLDGIGDDYTKYIVVISDGAPTGSDGQETPAAAAVAINTANSIKEDESIKIYAIGYETDATTSQTLKSIASGDDYFMEADANAIANKFEEVASSITNSDFAGTNAVLTDNIGNNFTVTNTASDDISVGTGNVSTNIGNITESGTKIAFEVGINGDEADGWVNVNEGFTLTYTDASGNPRTVTYGADEPQPQVYWERNTYNYVINYYKEEVTNTNDNEHYLGTSGNLSAFNGEEITLTDTEKNAYLPTPGYELSDSNVYTITIDKTKDNIINVLYERLDLTFGYKYLFEDTDGNYNEDSNYPGNNSVSAKYGDEVSYTSYVLENAPEGYELDTTKTEGSNNGTYTITDNNTMINIYYSRESLTYDVRYLFEDLDGEYVALDDVTGLDDIETKYGYEVSYSDHTLTTVPEGYALDTVKSTENNNGIYTITDNDTIVYVYYKRINSNFTVDYFFNGTPFDDIYSYSGDAIYGSTLYAIDYRLETVNNEALENKNDSDDEDYFLDPNDANNSASITVETSNNNMSLYYISTQFEEDAEEITKSSTTESITNVNQKVDYTIVYENTINNVREGDVITVTITDTLPYEIDESASELVSDGVEGVYDNSNKTITWTFTETAAEYTEEYEIEKTVSFKVVYKDFADLSSAEDNNLVNTANGVTTINNKSTDGSTSDSEEIPVVITGDLTVTYKTESEVFESTTTTEPSGTEYSTEEKDFFGYRLVSINGNKNGKYLPNQTVTVEYIYELSDGEITENEVTKEGPEIISDVNDFAEYIITYTGVVKDYIGKAVLTVTDILPFQIAYAGFDYRCDYDGDRTFTCVVEYDITEQDYVDGVYNINEEFYLDIIYGGIDSDIITNNVESKLELREIYADSDDSVDSKVLKGSLIVNYVDEEGSVLDSYTITDYAGTYYETEEKEFDGYTFKSSSDNTEGFLLADETLTVEYVYSKNIGTSEEVEEMPPFTGIQSINTNYIVCILSAFVILLLSGKKKEIKNN